MIQFSTKKIVMIQFSTKKIVMCTVSVCWQNQRCRSV